MGREGRGSRAALPGEVVWGSRGRWARLSRGMQSPPRRQLPWPRLLPHCFLLHCPPGETWQRWLPAACRPPWDGGRRPSRSSWERLPLEQSSHGTCQSTHVHTHTHALCQQGLVAGDATGLLGSRLGAQSRFLHPKRIEIPSKFLSPPLPLWLKQGRALLSEARNPLRVWALNPLLLALGVLWSAEAVDPPGSERDRAQARALQFSPRPGGSCVTSQGHRWEIQLLASSQ